MVHVSIEHVIGTVALIGLVVAVALSYQITAGYLEENTIRSQLRQMAEYVSMSIANIVSLMEFTYGALSSGTVSKSLNLPATIGGEPYNITIIEKSGGYYVHVTMIKRAHLHAESSIPVSPTRRLQVFTGEEELQIILHDESIEPRAWVCGGPYAVVWCQKEIDGVVYIGLGVRRGG
ncbi:MAG: hypothetical protein N3F04_05480 [Candidatus Nezhaarchaeota archaeon]|nr:hypothetical protein [Candidatus Nezhaarchaeota archaeon]MCX8142193.1 hypothetical protein [Candidatus Nezhaarchaeota archaeon]MDW8050024.1 hypothetical protein [Nitrososphaerota archaeon]